MEITPNDIINANNPNDILHIEGYNGIPVLIYFIRKRETKIVNLLLQNENIDVMKSQIDGNTPLHEACSTHDYDTISKLISMDTVNVNAMQRECCTPLYSLLTNISTYDKYQVHEKIVDVFRKFINHPDFNIKQIMSAGRTLFHFIVNRDYDRFYLEFVDIIAEKFGLKVEDSHGFTLVHAAILKKNYNALQVLMKYKDFDINIKNKDSNTPLHLLCNGIYNDYWADKFDDNILDIKHLDFNALNKKGQPPLNLINCDKDSLILDRFKSRGARFKKTIEWAKLRLIFIGIYKDKDSYFNVLPISLLKSVIYPNLHIWYKDDENSCTKIENFFKLKYGDYPIIKKSYSNNNNIIIDWYNIKLLKDDQTTTTKQQKNNKIKKSKTKTNSKKKKQPLLWGSKIKK